MKRERGDAFGFEIIAEGSFSDEGFKVRTFVIRLSCTAMNEWYLLKIQPVFTNDKEREAYKVKNRSKRQAWERKILDQLGFPDDTDYSITQSSSEIFTVVLFEAE